MKGLDSWLDPPYEEESIDFNDELESPEDAMENNSEAMKGDPVFCEKCGVKISTENQYIDGEEGETIILCRKCYYQKPAFIPLKKKYYLEFKNGTKNTEYRKYGNRWTEKNFQIGRQVTLSLGYGKQNRMTKTIVDCYKINSTKLSSKIQNDIYICYGEKNIDILAIELKAID
jgi:hypothetical protein